MKAEDKKDGDRSEQGASGEGDENSQEVELRKGWRRSDSEEF